MRIEKKPGYTTPSTMKINARAKTGQNQDRLVRSPNDNRLGAIAWGLSARSISAARDRMDDVFAGDAIANDLTHLAPISQNLDPVAHRYDLVEFRGRDKQR